MLLQMNKTGNGASNGTRPYKGKKTPSPITLTAKRHERQRRIRTRNMPIDGGMIPLAQTLLPFRVMTYGMIDGRGRITAQHTKQIEYHPYPRPVIVALETPHQENDADDDTQQNATAMRRGIPYLLFLGISYHVRPLPMASRTRNWHLRDNRGPDKRVRSAYGLSHGSVHNPVLPTYDPAS